jgi:hypothetical protein
MAANLKFTLKRNNGTDYDELYPKTNTDQVVGLATALSGKVNTSAVGAANGVASLDADGKVPFAQLPSSVVGGMKYSGNINASGGTSEATAVGLDTLFTELTYANFQTVGLQSTGMYKVVTNAGFIKNFAGTDNSVAYFEFQAGQGIAIGEEEDNTSPIRLEVGDWVVLNSTFSPSAGVRKYYFSIVNNTYGDAGVGIKGVVAFSQYADLQALDDDSALRASDIYQFLSGGDQNGAAATGIAITGHTHSQYQPLDADLTAIAGLTPTDSNIIVGNGTTWVTETGATARTSLGLTIGTHVQAYDAGLNSIAALSTAANKMIYTTASDTYAVADLTAAGRALLDDADAAAQRTTLGLAIGTNVQAYSARLVDIAALAVTDSNIIVGNGTTWVAETGATARTSLGVYSTSQVDAFFTNRPTILYNTTTGAVSGSLILADVVTA